MMDLAMMGSGTGAVIEERHIENLPAIRNRIKLKDVGDVVAAHQMIDVSTPTSRFVATPSRLTAAIHGPAG